MWVFDKGIVRFDKEIVKFDKEIVKFDAILNDIVLKVLSYNELKPKCGLTLVINL